VKTTMPLPCSYGFWRTDRTGGIDLRIRRLGISWASGDRQWPVDGRASAAYASAEGVRQPTIAGA
jgi:hypothetical protein